MTRAITLSVYIAFFGIQCYSISAQQFVADLIKSEENRHTIEQGVSKKTEVNYTWRKKSIIGGRVLQSRNIDIYGVPKKLFIKDSIVTNYISANETISKGFDGESKHLYTINRIFDKEGRLVQSDIKYTNPKIGKFKDLDKKIQYDKKGRIVEIIDNNQTTFSITYQDGLLPDSIYFKDIVTFYSGKAQAIGDTFRFVFNKHVPRKYSIFISKQDILDGYLDVIINEDKYHFYQYQFDDQEERYLLQNFQVFDKNLRTYEHEKTKTTEQHCKYTYKNGKLFSRVNLPRNTVDTLRYNQLGQVTTSYKKLEKINYSYDKLGKPTQILRLYSFAPYNFKSLTTITYEYK